MMPVLFVGHGTPMNIIEDNLYTRGWRQAAADIPKPSAVLVISAHWVTEGTKVSIVEKPDVIYDFYGFPGPLYQLKYPAAGSPELAWEAIRLLGDEGHCDHQHGLDHGAWGVLKIMYPEADVPVFQMSIDLASPPEKLFGLGRKLSALRSRGVLIVGSGNVVHNLSLIDYSRSGGFDWAEEFDEFVCENIRQRRFDKVIRYQSAGSCSDLAFFTPEHFYPLLYVLGAVDDGEKVRIFNQSCLAGSLSMTSYLFG